LLSHHLRENILSLNVCTNHDIPRDRCSHHRLVGPPGFVALLGVLPGTGGMAGYKDARWWTINLLKGFALAPIVGVLVAGVVFLFFR
jgi:hypothetical protein